MPSKFFIHPNPAPPRHRPVGKLGIVDWREDCSSCHNCVKKGCVYGLYREEYDALKNEMDYLDYIYQCKGCLTCIQNCTKDLLARVVNPEYRRLGDEHFSPEIVQATWYQASTGAIPVSGAGYGGKFSGEGFDAIWTDMSEIVRPTRDGIHGREYINTGVDMGRKLNHLSFKEGELDVTPPPLQSIPMPLIFDVIPEHWRRGKVVECVIAAAKEVGIKSVVGASDVPDMYENDFDTVIPWTSETALNGGGSFGDASMVMVSDGKGMVARLEQLKSERPGRIVMVRVDVTPEATGRIVKLVQNGVDVVHLAFDHHGYQVGAQRPKHMRDVLREVHTELVREGIRDEVTLVASGGIALAEHMAKAVLCGADLVAIDVPLLLALECRLCLECEKGGECQIALEDMDGEFGKRRIVNLLSAWHSQLLELMGAMGIREARRLRGETGRCMFFEDMEKETFGQIFGNRIEKDGA